MSRYELDWPSSGYMYSPRIISPGEALEILGISPIQCALDAFEHSTEGGIVSFNIKDRVANARGVVGNVVAIETTEAGVSVIVESIERHAYKPTDLQYADPAAISRLAAAESRVAGARAEAEAAQKKRFEAEDKLAKIEAERQARSSRAAAGRAAAATKSTKKKK